MYIFLFLDANKHMQSDYNVLDENAQDEVSQSRRINFN